MTMKNLNKMANVHIFGRNKTQYSTKIFNGTILHVAYKTKYTSQPLLQPKPSIKKKKYIYIYNHSGVY